MNKITLGFFLTNSKTTIKGLSMLVVILFMNTQVTWGQISITGTGSGNAYSQNFDSLANTGTSSVVPAGWVFEETGAGSDTNYEADNGSSAIGNTYSYGSTGDPERALGVLRSGNDIVPAIGVSFTNNTSNIITELIVSYTGEQWRLGDQSIGDRIDVFYSLNATSLSTGSWNYLSNLRFNPPITTGTVGALDGNAAANRTTIAYTISNLAIAPGQTFWFSFSEYFNLPVNNGLAIDDFSIYANSPTIWDGSTWSNGAPSTSVEAIIDGTYNTKPIIDGGNGTFNAKKLTVNSGKSLTINSLTNVAVQNEVINNGSLVVENNANLIQVEYTTNIGAITVNRDSNPLKRLDYTLWSSPVSGVQTLEDFSPLTSQTPTSRFYIYDNTQGATGLYSSVSPTVPFATGTGYLIRMPNEDPSNLGTSSDYYLGTGTPTITYNGVFTGTPNNGPVTLGDPTPLASDKYYAVGNPYPSTISANSFLSGNSTDGTLYFWRKTNGVVNSGSAYSSYTTLGGTAGSNVAPNNIAPDGTIAVGQGFIVKTGILATTLNFTNAMRTGNNSAQFFKTKPVAQKDRIWLNLTNTTGLFSQVLVGYMNGATIGVDAGIDGKYINDSKIALTSNINNEEYTIQGRPAFDASDVVALNFKTDKAGDYTIAIDHADGLFATGQDIYLVDSKTGTETNLKTDAYTFTAASGIDNARFSLKYQKTLKVDAPAFNENSVTVYKNKGTVYVNSGAVTIANVKVFDIQGRLIAEQKNVKANTVTINNLKATQQVLIVQITSEDKKVVNKKVLN